jgi:hypothetical protein
MIYICSTLLRHYLHRNLEGEVSHAIGKKFCCTSLHSKAFEGPIVGRGGGILLVVYDEFVRVCTHTH